MRGRCSVGMIWKVNNTCSLVTFLDTFTIKYYIILKDEIYVKLSQKVTWNTICQYSDNCHWLDTEYYTTPLICILNNKWYYSFGSHLYKKWLCIYLSAIIIMYIIKTNIFWYNALVIYLIDIQILLFVDLLIVTL